jgi:hypothetical protein
MPTVPTGSPPGSGNDTVFFADDQGARAETEAWPRTETLAKLLRGAAENSTVVAGADTSLRLETE